MSAIICEHCGLPIFGHDRAFTQQRLDERKLHLSCEDALRPLDVDDPNILKAFEVEVMFTGRQTVRVLARTRDEAEERAEDADIDTWRCDIDVESVELSDRWPSPMEMEAYDRLEKCEAERKKQRDALQAKAS